MVNNGINYRTQLYKNHLKKIGYLPYQLVFSEFLKHQQYEATRRPDGSRGLTLVVENMQGLKSSRSDEQWSKILVICCIYGKISYPIYVGIMIIANKRLPINQLYSILMECHSRVLIADQIHLLGWEVVGCHMGARGVDHPIVRYKTQVKNVAWEVVGGLT